MAVNLARALEDDVNVPFAKHGGIEDLLPMFYNVQCEAAGIKEAYCEHFTDGINFKMYDVGVAIF
jgi:hypothetical protein